MRCPPAWGGRRPCLRRSAPGAPRACRHRRARRARAPSGRSGRMCAPRPGPRPARRTQRDRSPDPPGPRARRREGVSSTSELRRATSCGSRNGTPGSSSAARARLRCERALTATTRWPAARRAPPSTAPTRPTPITPTSIPIPTPLSPTRDVAASNGRVLRSKQHQYRRRVHSRSSPSGVPDVWTNTVTRIRQTCALG